jgi:hypothetical protein
MILKSVDVIHVQNKSLSALRIPYNQPFAIAPIHRDPSVVFEYNWSVLVLTTIVVLDRPNTETHGLSIMSSYYVIKASSYVQIPSQQWTEVRFPFSMQLA